MFRPACLVLALALPGCGLPFLGSPLDGAWQLSTTPSLTNAQSRGQSTSTPTPIKLQLAVSGETVSGTGDYFTGDVGRQEVVTGTFKDNALTLNVGASFKFKGKLAGGTVTGTAVTYPQSDTIPNVTFVMKR